MTTLPPAPQVEPEWAELGRLFKEAEDAIHVAETITGDLPLPAVNQLRYAGHHLLKAKNAVGEGPDEHLQRARRHCQRSVYDAFDHTLMYLLLSVAEFKKDYRKIQIIPLFPEYHALLQTAEAAKQVTIKARSSNEDRDKYYIQAKDSTDTLAQYVAKADLSREELNKAVAAHNVKTLVAIFTVLGAIAAIVALI